MFSYDASTLTGTEELDSDTEPVNSYFGRQDNNSELYSLGGDNDKLWEPRIFVSSIEHNTSVFISQSSFTVV